MEGLCGSFNYFPRTPHALFRAHSFWNQSHLATQDFKLVDISTNRPIIVDMSTNSPTTQPSVALLDAFSTLRRELSIIRTVLLKPMDMGHVEVTILYRLTLSDATMGEISEYAVADKAAVSRAIAGLESSGLVTRITDENDRRISIVSLTAKGRTQARKSVALREALASRVRATLSAADQKELTRLLSKVAGQLQEERK